MKARRLLSALILLQGSGRISTRALAEKMQVSERTAHRDMEELCQAGVPLVAYRGSQGGWELEKEWRTRVPGLDEAELRALLMAQPTALSATSLRAAAESAWQKLMAAMPAGMQSRASSMLARLHIDSTGWGVFTEDVRSLPALQDAVAHDRQIRFVYERPGVEPYERTVDPLGLVWKQSIWYLVARTDRGMRTYRVSRMRDVAVLASEFQRPEFDLGEYWQRSTAALEDLRQRYTAKLLLTRDAEATLRRWLPVSMGEGPGEATVRFESMGQAQFVCLGLGSAVEVVSPLELREAVASEVLKMAGRVRRWSRRRD